MVTYTGKVSVAPRPPAPTLPEDSSRDHRVRSRAARRLAHPAVRDVAARPAGRPDRAGRAQRRGQDDDAAQPRGRRRALRRHDPPHRAGRLPAAGPPRGRPHRARARPRAVGQGARRAAARHGEDADRDGRAGRRRRARQGDRPLRPPRGAVRRPRGLRRRERGGAHLLEPRPARARAVPAPADALGRSAPARRAGPHPLRRQRRLGRQRRDDAAARRAHEPPRRRLDRLAALRSCSPTTAGSS